MWAFSEILATTTKQEYKTSNLPNILAVPFFLSEN